MGKREDQLQRNLKGLQNWQMNVHLNEEKLPMVPTNQNKGEFKRSAKRASKGTS